MTTLELASALHDVAQHAPHARVEVRVDTHAVCTQCLTRLDVDETLPVTGVRETLNVVVLEVGS